MYSASRSSPSSRIFCGVLATTNRRRVALLTPTSVAWAESSTAASSSKTLAYSSSVCGDGLAVRRISKNSRIWVWFMASGLCGQGVRADGGRGRAMRGGSGAALGPGARQRGFDDGPLAIDLGHVGEPGFRLEVIQLVARLGHEAVVVLAAFALDADLVPAVALAGAL